MALSPGTRIGSYEIAEQIGVGGMGEVYRATDMNLDRQVAIKVLPDTVAADAERLARFDREAKTLAALNHPNIAAIYGLERADGQTALVMELVEGPTLADRIAQGPVPVDDALAIAKQIAGALEAAHGRGIIHRDLKPANVKLRPDGAVKVLDFGLAKAVDSATAQGTSTGLAFSQSPTITTPAMTQAGVILGTAAYMSPEQAKGLPVDRRSDVWAFGTVLYEMLTGRRAFDGVDVSEVFAAVIKLEPDWTALPELPPLVESFLRQALRKDPAQRLADMQDMRLALEGAFADIRPAASIEAPAAPRWWQRSGAVAVAALAVGGALAGAVAWTIWPTADPRVSRLSLGLADYFPVQRLSNNPAIDVSPDGSRVAYVADVDGQQSLVVREMNGLEPTPLYQQGEPVTPVFSPDSAWVAFDEQAASVLMKVSVDGEGEALPVAELRGALRGIDWGTDGYIVFGTAAPSGLWRVRDDGEALGEITALDDERGDANHLFPRLLPDGTAVLFTIAGRDGAHSIAVADLATNTTDVLIEDGSYPIYSPTGHILYMADGALRARPFDARARVVTGRVVPLPDVVRTLDSGAADVAMADDGTFVYLLGRARGDIPRSLAWVDASGGEQPVPGLVGPYEWVSLSPDGKRAALGIGGDRPYVEIADLERGFSGQRVNGAQRPLWNTAETILVARQGEQPGVYEIPLGSTQNPRLLVASTPELRQLAPEARAPDGQRLILQAVLGPTGGGIWPQLLVATMGDPGSLEPLFGLQASASAHISPTGRHIAYGTTGRGEGTIVVVEPFPGGGLPVPVGPGFLPKWSEDGRTLSYLRDPGSGRAVMRRVSVTGEASGTIVPGEDSELFPYRYWSPRRGTGFFDMTADGSRFLVITGDNESPEGIVVQGFADELRRRAPAD